MENLGQLLHKPFWCRAFQRKDGRRWSGWLQPVCLWNGLTELSERGSFVVLMTGDKIKILASTSAKPQYPLLLRTSCLTHLGGGISLKVHQWRKLWQFLSWLDSIFRAREIPAKLRDPSRWFSSHSSPSRHPGLKFLMWLVPGKRFSSCSALLTAPGKVQGLVVERRGFTASPLLQQGWNGRALSPHTDISWHRNVPLLHGKQSHNNYIHPQQKHWEERTQIPNYCGRSRDSQEQCLQTFWHWCSK